MKHIYLRLHEEEKKGTPLVLATVTSTIGSTPQKPGSSALIGPHGLLAGTVGGGIVEGKVLELAALALASGKSGHYTFDLAHEISDQSEAICGGKITVLVDANVKNSQIAFQKIGTSLAEKKPGVLITMVTRFTEDNVLINRYWMTTDDIPALPEDFLKVIEPEVRRIINSGNHTSYRQLELSVKNEEPSSLFFLEPVFPPEQLVIAGAGHIGSALAHLGSMLNFEVTVIDDRGEYANFANIPDADHIIVSDIGNAVSEIPGNEKTYIVIVTRGHKDDASALRQVIGQPLAYIGMIGSKKKIAAMRSDFIEKGLATADQWKKIHAPVGLDIKSQTVEEIAISIAAQLVLVRNSK